jgi:hypothetical protein
MLVLSSVILFATILFLLRDIKKNNLWNSRFVELPALLELRRNEIGEEEDFSDEVLRRISREASGQSSQDSKKVTVSIVIDLEEVSGYDMWTTNKFSDEAIYADSTYITFYSGEAVMTIMPFEEFDVLFNNYLGQKKNYLI